MPPIYLSDASTYDYDEIPPGYYYQAMLKGPAVQRFWHTYKSREIARSIAENSNVLDVGCGGGTFLYVLGQSRKNIEAIGVDIAQAQIDFCAQTIAPQFHKITFKKISAESLPFADASFDYVTSVQRQP